MVDTVAVTATTEKDLVQAGRQPYVLRAGLGSFAWNQSDDNVSIQYGGDAAK